MRYHFRRAFTLVELMIVVIILGILASVVMAMVSTSGDNARQAGAHETAQRVQTAVRLYEMQTGRLPDLTGGNWAPLTQQTNLGDKVVGPYLLSVPRNVEAVGDPTVVVDTAADIATTDGAFAYDYRGGQGTGRFVEARPLTLP